MNFDLFHLQPAASLNSRRFLVTAPEDRAIEGKSAYEFLSAQALAQQAAAILDVSAGPTPTTSQILRQLSHALALNNAAAAAAVTLVEQYGRRLGYFLASMNPANRLSPVDDPWERAYLAHWANGIDEIVLGGGLASGRMGDVMARAAQHALVQNGKQILITVAKHPHALALIGAARSVSTETHGVQVVADFGQSGAKTGLATYTQGALAAITQRPTVEIAAHTTGEKVGDLAAAMRDTLINVYHVAHQESTDKESTDEETITAHIICALAAYLDDEQQPVQLTRGAYTRLHTIAQPASVSAWLAREVSRGVGREVRISFLRDAEAAAVAYAGLRPPKATVVLMLGTTLGAGFVPEAKGYRPIVNDFTLI